METVTIKIEKFAASELIQFWKDNGDWDDFISETEYKHYSDDNEENAIHNIDNIIEFAKGCNMEYCHHCQKFVEDYHTINNKCFTCL